MKQISASDRARHLGPLLRRWRTARGKSQLDLAVTSSVSQRHLSFIESGRSVPTRAMLMTLADALDVPFRDRNSLLLAAGYAPAYEESGLEDSDMAAVEAALTRMLAQQEPFPALVMDRHWNVVRTNQAAPRLFGRLIDLAAYPQPRNLLRLIFDPQALRPHILDWNNLASAMIARLHRESVGRILDEAGQRLLRELLSFPGVDPKWQQRMLADTSPVVPLSLRMDGEVLRYFSMVCTVGTPQSIATQEIRLECMFPADDASEKLHLRLIGDRDE